MTAIHFALPANLTTKKLFAALNEHFETHLVSRQYILKTYYDSFDWRLYKHDLICEFNRTKQSSTLLINNRKTNDLVASTILFDVPSFGNQFNPGKVRQTLEPALGIRALTSICMLECETIVVDVIEKKEKIALRLLIEEFELLNNRLTLLPAKEHSKLRNKLADLLINDLNLTVENKPVLVQALALQGRQPKEYSAKLEFPFTAAMPAERAVKTVFNGLLKILKLNEQGVIADTDSEFLHDFRIAVRKTRVGLSQMKKTLPPDIIMKNKAFFSWLSNITSECRDLDVYLINFEAYKKILPPASRQDINPLELFLATKKQKAYNKLSRQLRSKKYLTALAHWEAYLTSEERDRSNQSAGITVKVLADKRIKKTYKQIIKLGDAIDQHSAPNEFHKLRKLCKKLRYLLEFFQNLYPKKRVNKLISSLKKLQDVLGDFQDYAVQQKQLHDFSHEMPTNTSPKTLLAIGVLIQAFENRKSKARNRFDAQFAAFKKTGLKSLF